MPIYNIYQWGDNFEGFHFVKITLWTSIGLFMIFFFFRKLEYISKNQCGGKSIFCEIKILVEKKENMHLEQPD